MFFRLLNAEICNAVNFKEALTQKTPNSNSKIFFLMKSTLELRPAYQAFLLVLLW